MTGTRSTSRSRPAYLGASPRRSLSSGRPARPSSSITASKARPTLSTACSPRRNCASAPTRSRPYESAERMADERHRRAVQGTSAIGVADRGSPASGEATLRRTLVVATALATALVFAAFWYALGIRPLRFTSGPELYNTNAKPTDALANMRDCYADLTRSRPASSLPQPVPQLGPPLPGDLGRPMLQQQTGTPTPAADPEAERRRREREQAAASVVFFTVSARPLGPSGVAPALAAGGATPATSADGIAPQTSAGDDLTVQNGQSHKEAFLNVPVDQAIYSPQRLQTPRSPYQLMAWYAIT